MTTSEDSIWTRMAVLIFLAILAALSLALPDPTNDAYVYHFQDLNRREDISPITPKEGYGWYTWGPYLSLPPGTVRASLEYEATEDGNEVDYSMAEGTRALERTPLPREERSQTLRYESLSAPIQNFQLRSIYSGKGTLKVHKVVVQHLQSRFRPLTWNILIAAFVILAAYGLFRRRFLLARPGLWKLLAVSALGAAAFLAFWFVRLRLLSLDPAYWEDGLIQLAICTGIAAIVSAEFGDRASDAARVFGLGIAFAASFFATAAIEEASVMAVNDISVIWRVGMQIPAYLLLLEAFLRHLPLKAPRAKGGVWALTQLFLIFPPVWNLVYFTLFGQTFGYDAIFGIYQTNPDQALEFLSQYVPQLIGLILGLLGLAAALAVYGSRRIFARSEDLPSDEAPRTKRLLLPAGLAAAVILSLSGIADSAAETPAAREYAKIDRYFKSLSDRSLDSGISVRRIPGRQEGPKTKVVVVGESAAKDHMSLYGYGRPTSPWMDAHRDEWLIFDHAYAANKFTIYALEYALSEENQYNGKTFGESLSAVEALQRAGYRVSWLSNQKPNSNHNTPFGLIAKRANRSFWTPKAGKGFDEALLPEFKKLSPKDDNVVFLHLNGSHGLYKERYPKEKQVFSRVSDNVVDEYDDTILYTDGFLREIFEYARDNLNLDAFIYFSDHGEDPGVPRDRFHWPMMRIPLVMWFSDEYRANHPERIRRLEERRQSAFWGVDMLYDTLLGLFDVETDRMDRRYDLSAEEYAASADSMVVEGGKHKVSDDPALAPPNAAR